MNPQPSDLESDALAVRATGLCLCFLMGGMPLTGPTILLELYLISSIFLILHACIVFILTFCALKKYYLSHVSYPNTSVTTPAPTVLPPSLMANLSSFSIAIGAINSTLIVKLSPGITISTPSGNCDTPVTSVVLK